MKNYLRALLVLFCGATVPAFAQNNSWLDKVNPKSVLTKEQLIKDKLAIKAYHPNPFNSFPERKWDSLINVISTELPLVAIRESEKTLIRRRILDRMTFEDPHVRFLPTFGKEGHLKVNLKKIKALPFTLLNINDTLLIDCSYNDELQKGDRILSINNEDVSAYLNSTYRDRYMSGFDLQTYHHFRFSTQYEIEIVRGSKHMYLKVPGLAMTDDFFSKIEGSIEEKIFDNYKTAYFNIPDFNHNKVLVKRFGCFLNKVVNKGYKNVIIDIRKNTGGGGDYFDELFSMLTQKSIIPLQSGARLKVSKATYKYYNYSEDDFGKVVDLPDSLFVKEGVLDSLKYKGDINYYVLISRNTGSMAASFANMMQFNGIGILVGEQLNHNALNYGEVIIGERDCSFFSISTIENFQYTKAKNGYLKPDIKIPFVGSEYMKGGDPVLEKCLNCIKNRGYSK